MPLLAGQIGADREAEAFLAAYVRSEHVHRVYLAAAEDEAAAALRKRFGIIKATPDRAALLADPQVALVSVSLPLDQQATAVEEALQAGKDVLCPAPLAATLEEADHLLAAARASGRRLWCTMPQLLLPAHIRAAAGLQEGELGRPVLATIHALEPQVSASPLEALTDPVSLLEYWLGPVTAVTATAAAATHLVNLEFASGSLGQITLCQGAAGDHPYQERRLVCAQGSLLIRDNPEDEWPLVLLQGDDFQPLKVKNPPQVQTWARREAVVSALEALTLGQPEGPNLAAARSALRTTLATLEAAPTGTRQLL